MNRFSKLPSPAMAVAFVALLAALTGTAVALPGSNTVTSGDIKNSQVKTQDIRNSTVRGRDVRNNTLTGSDVRESSLGTVPRANTAGTASTASTAGFANTAGAAGSAGTLNSQRKISYFRTGAAAATVIFSNGGLTISAACSAAGAVTVTASTSVDHAAIISYGNAGDTNDADFLISETPTISSSNEERDIVYTHPGGSVTTVQYLAAETAPFGTANSCLVRGIAQTL